MASKRRLFLGFRSCAQHLSKILERLVPLNAQQTKAIQDALAAKITPVTPTDLAKQLPRGNATQIEEILDAPCFLGLKRKSRE